MTSVFKTLNDSLIGTQVECRKGLSLLCFTGTPLYSRLIDSIETIFYRLMILDT